MDPRKPKGRTLAKTPTGISGLDEITGGGLPKGRPTLICGSAGCGKTLMGMEFLIRGATEFGEPGVFVTFEEKAEDLAKNVASLGYDLNQLVARKKILIDYVRVEKSEIEETGEYDLGGLFVRLDYAIKSIKAKRVVLDTIESLFSGLSNAAILRAELRRLFEWLKDRGVTAIITGERGESTLTRQGLEEYVSDCVILLDHRVIDQISTRRLRVVKYRGSTHGTNEYPFLIDEDGLSVLPVTSLGLDHPASNQRLSSGVRELDHMLGGKGFYRGSTILVTGSAGTGKTTLAMHLTAAACRRGERCLFFGFEESPAQIVRNLRSVGIDLEPWCKKGLLRISSSRPTMHGLEMHLAIMHKEIERFKPSIVIVDPITTLLRDSNETDVATMLMRLIDFLKMQGTTLFMTSLTTKGQATEQSNVNISSLIDAWLILDDIQLSGERNHTIMVVKARGMSHSNQLREFRLTNHGIQLIDAYLGPDGVFTGSSRLAQEAKARSQSLLAKQEEQRRAVALERKRKNLFAQISSLQDELADEAKLAKIIAEQGLSRGKAAASATVEMRRSRRVN